MTSTMKLIDQFYQYDFGHEYHLNILPTSRFNVVELYVGVDEAFSGKLPYISFQLGGDSILYFSLGLYKFMITVDLFSFHPVNLNYLRGNY